MRTRASITPSSRAIKKYYERVEALERQHVFNEMNVRSAFEFLLADTVKTKGWTLVPELSAKSGGSLVRPDGTVRDVNSLPRGYWEAKDTQDDLETEIRKKIARGYPLSNIIFEDTQTGVLFQNKQKINGPYNLGNAKELAALLNQFLSHTEPDIESFEEAVEEFKERVPDLARGLVAKIQEAHKDNTRFQQAFEKFFELCRGALNPNIRIEAVDEMLVQHLLTERLFRTIFNNPEFVRRNAIAAEVERVIDALLSHSFDRNEYLKGLNRFYVAIESAARTLPDFSEKQHFLNTVYERFFQGYSVKIADTHGIVYTPQPIVDFMCASVAEVLEKEFGTSLSSPDVYVIDPCTGTGNFIVNLLRRVSHRDLPRVYRQQFFANEVMLLPYYIAALNIEHAYYGLTGEYEPFEGLCFVDTLDLAEHQEHQMGITYITETNAARIDRQKKTPITVIIGNPPYNVGQQNENDNNKNRKYKIVDERIRETYAKASKATLKTKLYDPYVKFFRWATDRLQGRDGIVCLVSNNSFIDQQAFDGMQQHLLKDFSSIYHVDLHGNVQKNPKLSGTTHNVFGIKVGVGITLAVRRTEGAGPRFHYFRVPETWRKEEKLDWLSTQGSAAHVKWQSIPPGEWLTAGNVEFDAFIALGSKQARAAEIDPQTAFKLYSLGVSTNRDDVVYGFDGKSLRKKVQDFCENYNTEVDRYKRTGNSADGAALDRFLNYAKVKWSRDLKKDLRRGSYAEFDERFIRTATYRPFTKRFLYLADLMNDTPGLSRSFFPDDPAEEKNRAIVVTSYGSEKPFMALTVNRVSDLHLVGAGCGSEIFPFYVYESDGVTYHENITGWTLEHFRKHYGDDKITKWDIFHYIYAVLHHPEYRSKYAENLKRELPRIPLVGSGTGVPPVKDHGQDGHATTDHGQDGRATSTFWAFANAGKELAHLHVDYDKLEPYELAFKENRSKPLSYRVEDKMRLSKDRKSLKVNDTLTLAGIPPETFEYRLGNRSGLEWVVDQYRVKEDKRSGIRSDPNCADDPEYIVRLVGQVIHVSLETVRIVKSLPAL